MYVCILVFPIHSVSYYFSGDLVGARRAFAAVGISICVFVVGSVLFLLTSCLLSVHLVDISILHDTFSLWKSLG